MTKSFGLTLVGLALLCVSVAAGTKWIESGPAQARNTGQAPRALDFTEVPEGTRAVMVADAAAAPRPATPGPEAVVEELEHDFGIMNPRETGRQSFFIRNEGAAPLELKAGSTTCKCTVASLSQNVLAPGEVGEIHVDWDTVGETSWYSQSATITTNDPDHPKIRFTVHGKIRTLLGMDPPSFVFPRVAPDRPETKTALLFSQVWDQFAVEDIEASLDAIAWQFRPAPPEALERFHAKSGYYLDVTLPADLPQGFFAHWLRFRLKTEGELTGPETRQIAITGKVLRRLSVYGRGIDGTGTIYIGPVKSGREERREFIVKVHDSQRDLPIKKIETTPGFLAVQLTPHRGSRRELGLYDLEVKVPADAPRCIFMGAPAAELKIRLNHPRIQDLTLPVKFAVVDG